ncbi:DUF1850 domain-containing protein [Virgibacillus alimentarius]|uniref:RocC n=1 Tax=Virgibacillus alimentarius TaxID=698769 RepID=A0ABS4SC02_9BACI|nr:MULTISPECIES: DUF1850 domain-containing protein [Virgibacillus]MBP2259003.1 hypothetical protein [Virgibacillus alimentarius]HLR68720.1 DUF1850 domain-containing protein [Virgibacillus sp.]
MAKKRITLLIGILLLVITLAFMFIPYKTALVFYKENTDQIEAFLPMNTGDHFQIIFKHSIHLTDVIEKYEVTRNHDIKQNEIVYEEFGIGMPSNAQEGEEFVNEDGKYYIKNLENIFPSMNIRNGKTVSEHRLVWGNQAEYRVWFNDYFQPGAWFKLKIEKLTLSQYLKEVKIHE